MAARSNPTSASPSAFRPLAERDYGAFFTIVTNAYPSFNLTSPEDRERFIRTLGERMQQSPMSYCGLYRDETLLGGARLHDFVMNVRDAQIAAAGIGMVAVDLAHKKEHVARDLIHGWLEYCRAQNAPFALLYPFRPDFYKAMGSAMARSSASITRRPLRCPPAAIGQRLR